MGCCGQVGQSGRGRENAGRMPGGLGQRTNSVMGGGVLWAGEVRLVQIRLGGSEQVE